MSVVNYKTFNLTRERPKVLLTGNGLTHSTGVPWHELIQRTARPGIDISHYEQTDGTGHRSFAVPNTVLTLAVSETGDRQRHEKYIKTLNKDNFSKNDCLETLLTMPFDAVLTTNYTYEWEDALHPGYPKLKEVQKRRYAYVIDGKRDGKYLLHTFNRFGEDKPDLWHIHGELRRPSSLILSHDEYARLVHAILAYNKSIGNSYMKHREALRFQSWVDYLILGDVYILGLGLDFSEFDLWWLLGRRLREKTECGNIVFFEPEKAENLYKQRALRDSGVQVNTCGTVFGESVNYDSFYKKAIGEIRQMLSAK